MQFECAVECAVRKCAVECVVEWLHAHADGDVNVLLNVRTKTVLGHSGGSAPKNLD